MRNYVGLDVGGTTMKGALVTAAGEIIFRAEQETCPHLGLDAVLDRMVALVDQVARAEGRSLGDVCGVGVGVPAFLDWATGFVETAVNLGWSQVPLRAELQKRLGDLPIALDNDANAAAFGEALVGGGSGARDALCVTLGTGVGGGILIDGKLVRGASGMGGEIGHIMLDEEGWLCNCGRRGCLETISSATGIVRAAVDRMLAGDESSLAAERSLSAALIFDHAARGDRLSCEVIEHAIDRLAFVLANIGTTLNPPVMLIGGGVSQAGEALLAPLKRAFDRYALPRVRRATEIRLATLGNDAGVIGAAMLLVEEL
ncbi:ROK family glucokinase [Tumebacillus lipolyticus]|uniref:Glucokinase n=1 Tax=Tumebacillus lipolyticus TaxID=1280370 RepID=A0ABW4ZW10_9BACL